MKQAKVLNKDEFYCALASIASMRYPIRNRVLLFISHYAGLRVGEISSLLVGDVLDCRYVPREQILLRALVTKSKEARTVFVNSALREELAAYAATLEGPRRDAASPLLTTQLGTAFTPNTLCQLFGRIYAKAGIDGASSHSGRRWFITKLAHSGVSPKVIMTLAGHKNLTTTQRYIDVNDEMMRAAVGLL